MAKRQKSPKVLLTIGNKVLQKRREGRGEFKLHQIILFGTESEDDQTS